MRHIKSHKKFSWEQGCWLLVSVLLLYGAIFTILQNNMSILNIARPLGFIMLISGAINFLVCELKNREIHGANWLIADGIIAICLSIFPLFNKLVSPILVPFFFCIWEMVSGVLKVMDSAELKSHKMECWQGFAVIGCIEMLSGAVSLLKPFDDIVGMGNVIAAIFFIQACGFMLKTAMYHHLVD